MSANFVKNVFISLLEMSNVYDFVGQAHVCITLVLILTNQNTKTTNGAVTIRSEPCVSWVIHIIDLCVMIVLVFCHIVELFYCRYERGQVFVKNYTDR